MVSVPQGPPPPPPPLEDEVDPPTTTTSSLQNESSPSNLAAATTPTAEEEQEDLDYEEMEVGDDVEVPDIHFNVSLNAAASVLNVKFTELLEKWRQFQDGARGQLETPDMTEFWNIFGHVQEQFREQFQFFMQTYIESEADEGIIFMKLCTYFQNQAKPKFDEFVASLRNQMRTTTSTTTQTSDQVNQNSNSNPGCSKSSSALLFQEDGNGSLTLISEDRLSSTLVSEGGLSSTLISEGGLSSTLISEGELSSTFSDDECMSDDDDEDDSDSSQSRNATFHSSEERGSLTWENVEEIMLDDDDDDEDVGSQAGSATLVSEDDRSVIFIDIEDGNRTITPNESSDDDEEMEKHGSTTLISFFDDDEEESSNSSGIGGSSPEAKQEAINNFCRRNNILINITPNSQLLFSHLRVLIKRDPALDEKASTLQEFKSHLATVKCNMSDTSDSAFGGSSYGGDDVIVCEEVRVPSKDEQQRSFLTNCSSVSARNSGYKSCDFITVEDSSSEESEIEDSLSEESEIEYSSADDYEDTDDSCSSGDLFTPDEDKIVQRRGRRQPRSKNIIEKNAPQVKKVNRGRGRPRKKNVKKKKPQVKKVNRGFRVVRNGKKKKIDDDEITILSAGDVNSSQNESDRPVSRNATGCRRYNLRRLPAKALRYSNSFTKY